MFGFGRLAAIAGLVGGYRYMRRHDAKNGEPGRGYKRHTYHRSGAMKTSPGTGNAGVTDAS